MNQKSSDMKYSLTEKQRQVVRERAERYSKEWKSRVGWIDETLKVLHAARRIVKNASGE
jgi:hypothetical protein